MKELWRTPSFRWFWLGIFLSAVGNSFGSFGVSWYLLHRTGSGAIMGTSILSYYVPALISGLIAGVLLDRIDRRKLIIFDNVVRGSLYGLLVFLLSLPAVPVATVYIIMALAGMLSPLSSTGQQAMLPNLIKDKELLIKANSVMSAQWQIVWLFGPMLAGLAVTLIGPANVIIIDSISFFLCAACFLRVSYTYKPNSNISSQTKREALLHFWKDLVVGYRYIGTNSMLLSLLFFSLFFNMGYSPVELLPVYIQQVWGIGKEAYQGYMLTAIAIGSLFGSMLFIAKNWKYPIGVTVGAIICLWGLTTFPLGFTQRMEIAVVCFFVGGVVFAPFNVLISTYIQKQVPNEILGRVLTANRSITGFGLPVGSFLSGLLASSLGMDRIFVYCAVLCMLVGIIAMVRLRALQ
ncbi:MFS transporter [Brevibacillus laterosporus]|uniref:MFS transporter n=1 Tax=Brevibacillus laterosporus TaxID=1465 RepID=UPI000839D51B|nr:MFS transporter [Brevibacillus laterosporus]